MPSTPKILLILAGGIALFGIAVWQWEQFSAEKAPKEPASDREGDKSETAMPLADNLPPLVRAKSPYLNTTDQAKYVGNDACLKCHQSEYDSYQHTGHSRALAKSRPDEEPPNAEFYHAASKRHYKVYREEGKLRHREFIRDEHDRELVLNDLPVAWTIGSGRFSKSYLIEQDGFLIESPLTWYAGKNAWGMSPGYDQPQHPGFERLADLGCVVCHAGQVTGTEGNSFRPQILQATIGCENCHGPGSLHVERHESANPPPIDEDDLTIVNPAHLERSLSESICGNCHLRGEASVVRRGLALTDFRPGLPLTDVRIDYKTQAPQGEMEVVGHMEQMWQSRCYTESKTMTCITCHDPHHQPEPAERLAAYRKVCLECHAEDSCGLQKPKRLENSPSDDCVSCHMPTTDTDIPHFAFTHHRIAKPGTHKTKTENKDTKPSVLIPLALHADLSQLEAARNLGLAYLEYAEKQPAHYKDHLYHAGQLLEHGDPDSEGLAALARVYFEADLATAPEMAKEALRAKATTSSARVNALIVRGTHHLEAGRLPLAQKDLEQLTKLKRHPAYWQMLAEAHHRRKQWPETIQALENAVATAPDRVDLRKFLANVLRQTNQPEKAEAQTRAIEILEAPRKKTP